MTVKIRPLLPRKVNGNSGQVFAYNFMDRVVRHFHYLIDLHTASFGRANSLYVRANMTAPVTHRMACLQVRRLLFLRLRCCNVFVYRFFYILLFYCFRAPPLCFLHSLTSQRNRNRMPMLCCITPWMVHCAALRVRGAFTPSRLRSATHTSFTIR